MANILYGYYSEQQKKQYGSALYSKPDGSQVEVTEVSYDPFHVGAYNDVVDLGEVVNFICTLSFGMYPTISSSISAMPTSPSKQSDKQDKPAEDTTIAPSDISDWHSWANKTPGQCPCGIARQDCWIHKP